ncbi:30S ribosomal protein S5 [Candidatus Woesearchaeota archaeon]|nr:30S ribosomal protein S5 [Candidatus Woesearchaeota archaeon]MBT7238074.1 30S ribosomal protein S5 [Candidatus Woesearchaeota archaeon]
MSKEKKAEIQKTKTEAALASWIPKTEFGKQVKSGEIKDIDVILEKGGKILESEIVDSLFPDLEYELITIGQSKGKFGGGKRSIWKQTQKKTKEGNKPKFATVAVVGNRKGYVGIGYGKAKETVPAREKAIRQAKLNLIKVKYGCGSWDCACGEIHSIPFKVSGKCSSVIVELLPAPKGTNLCIHKELRKILTLAGIKDVYSKTYGKTNTQLNLVKACIAALKQLSMVKTK